MKSVQKENRFGQPVFVPVFNRAFERATLRNIGFCMGCGKVSDSTHVEPDAQRYPCEHCHQNRVYGLEELLLRGWVVTDYKADGSLR